MPHTPFQRILYIEDDDELARLLQGRMQQLRFTVDIANSAEEGIAMLTDSAYDIVLLDYHLPGMNGLEALEEIARMEQPTPVILLTSSGDERVAVSALEKGAADYAVKDTGQSYVDLLPAIMQAAYTRKRLQYENERQREELHAAKEKAEAANQAKSNFLATMSHEIRTPLNVVTGLTAMLAKTALNAGQSKILATLSSNAELLLKLINDLLDISRIEAGYMMLESRSFAFASILHDLELMFSEQVRQKNIALTFTDATTGNFYGDRTRIQQIAMNLVSNAIKFTETGAVSVSTEMLARDDGMDCIKLVVRDTGIGVAAEKLPTIFDKFTQADATITRRYGGSGLGLSIAHSLATLMDGDIRVQSDVGKGSVFTVTLCLQPAADQPADTKAPKPGPTAPVTGGTILLVEDYAPNIMVATMMLEDFGYTVVSASSGPLAIQKIEEAHAPFLAILMDVQMQGMDGLETTARIREIERQKGFRHTIIGVTAHALAGDRERCISAGMNDYISKPIHPDILAARLRAVAPVAA